LVTRLDGGAGRLRNWLHSIGVSVSVSPIETSRSVA